MDGKVIAVHLNASHTFSKRSVGQIMLLEGLGVEGDAHCGATVKHRSRVARDPSQPNLRQVHLVHGELFDQLLEKGFRVLPGNLGENVTTGGLDLLSLPVGTELHIGERSIVKLSGLRNPCAQIDHFQAGLMSAVLGRTSEGRLLRKAGVMGIVTAAGPVKPGDEIAVKLPPPPHRGLEMV
ncbi:MOSC domain-containing protein [Paraburkholderia kirstenboschensis]|uniref:MOSC domain-containing protein n=1 Tax=Paraburkholderia kirstenboschensis TaxID=1245436 RepID=A0ABZ0E9V2_9BURK|nr:MOSC domain-containing protein [Paraburkholderia kirstenboschensis]WOD13755.1 MOSC domain-containing protein [Paraburkholderia kirstenboschensis]